MEILIILFDAIKWFFMFLIAGIVGMSATFIALCALEMVTQYYNNRKHDKN